MAAIGPKDTEPEMIVRRYLHSRGFRYRLHVKDLPGKPDIVLPKYRTVVMVHGCFWHHHGCKNSVWPKTRAEFWRAKIKTNVSRDRRTMRQLQALGWRVIVVWECQIPGSVWLARTVRTLRASRFRGGRATALASSGRSKVGS